MSASILVSCSREEVVQPPEEPVRSPPIHLSDEAEAEAEVEGETPAFSIAAFASLRPSGTGFTLERVLQRNDAYTRHAISYQSNGLHISGIMNIPRGEGPFPLVVLNHGYIDPRVYVRGRGLKREQDFLTRHGYAVLHPDYRGHAGSDPSPNPHVFDAALEYSMDVVNAIHAVKNAQPDRVDTSSVGMLGHSLGGGIALNIAVSHPDLVDAFILYAPVSSDAWENFTRWEHEWDEEKGRQEAQMAREIYRNPEENPDFWHGISSGNFLENIDVPVLLFHSADDDDVPKEWSDRLAQQLRLLGKDITYVEYEHQGHEFVGSFTDFMATVAEFFDRELRREDAGNPDE